MIDITIILVGLIFIICGIVGLFVIKWVKSHISVEQLAMLQGIAQTAVFAAEKIFGAKMGPDKKAYAIAQVKKWLESKNITFDEEAINAAIEAQVQKLTMQFNGE